MNIAELAKDSDGFPPALREKRDAMGPLFTAKAHATVLALLEAMDRPNVEQIWLDILQALRGCCDGDVFTADYEAARQRYIELTGRRPVLPLTGEAARGTLWWRFNLAEHDLLAKEAQPAPRGLLGLFRR